MAGALAISAPAQGAQVIQEVVVTARKRGAESIQDIGGSIQVLDGDAMAEKMSTGFSDFLREVPSLSTNSSGTGQAQLSMRGISSARLNHANPNIPSTVSVKLPKDSASEAFSSSLIPSSVVQNLPVTALMAYRQRSMETRFGAMKPA